MILIDDRTGSIDLAGYIRHWKVPCEVTRLQFGDAAFAGNGPEGDTYVGIEIKAVHDALSCIGDGRFAGVQLPGLLGSYDRVWLVVEGQWYPNFSDGILRIESVRSHRTKELSFGARRFMYRELDHWLTTMEVRAGIRVRRTRDRRETARVIVDLFTWFSKPWADHRSHLALHEDLPDKAIFIKPSIIRKVASQLPGIGWGKSQQVEAKFRTVERMVSATPAEWSTIPGIGDKLAWTCYQALRSK